jgi:hypothetical protein
MKINKFSDLTKKEKIKTAYLLLGLNVIFFLMFIVNRNPIGLSFSIFFGFFVALFDLYLVIGLIMMLADKIKRKSG